MLVDTRKTPHHKHISPEVELLYIRHGLHQEPQAEHNQANHIHPSPAVVTRGGARGGVDEHDGETDGEHPDSLEYPEHGELEGVRPLVIKPVILTYFDDPVEEVSGEPEAPEHHTGGEDDLPHA